MTVYKAVSKANKKSEGTSLRSQQVVNKEFRFQCTLTPIAMGVFGEIGYCIRLETI